MTIGHSPAGRAVGAAAVDINSKPAKDAAKVPENEKAGEKAATEAYTIGISNAKMPGLNADTTIKNEADALNSAEMAKKKIIQNPNNAIGSLVFNNSRVANLMKGLAGTAAT
ncbi:MAG: hypothetical protein HQK99_03095 [Nitrospirae bacterium]|nr:hypothetical protein [Nitrospirota bacterium]